jgi:hypothetical protein
MYKNCKIDKIALKKEVIEESKNGHDVLSKISSKIPKLLFNSTKENK